MKKLSQLGTTGALVASLAVGSLAPNPGPLALSRPVDQRRLEFLATVLEVQPTELAARLHHEVVTATQAAASDAATT